MTSIEARVADICAKILGLDRIGLDDDLFTMGIDSHQAVLIALEIEDVFAVDLPIEVMEASARVQALAAWLEAQLAERAQAACATKR